MITKEQFLAAYNKYPPNAWTRFAFKYFSSDTVYPDNKVSHFFGMIMIGFFSVGMILTIVGLTNKVIAIVFIPFAVGVLGVVGLTLAAKIMNNWRIRRIAKKLGISVKEYNIYAASYL